MVKDDLIQDIQKKRANIAVIGMGYVGLPLAVTFATAGFSVTGIDPIQEKVDMINRGESYISDISNAQLRKHIDNGRIRATTDYSTLNEIDAISICVPTPLRKTGDPDMSFIAQVSDDIAPYLHRSMIIVLESSTYPHHSRICPAETNRQQRPQSRHGLLPGVFSRTRRPWTHGFHYLQYPKGRWRHHPGMH